MPTRAIKNTNQASKQEKTLTKLPTKEISWVKSILQNGKTFYTTSNPERTQYYLYEKTKDGFRRIAKAQSPVDFNKILAPLDIAEAEKKPRKMKPVSRNS